MRLFQVKGKICSVCVQRRPIRWQHFNSGYIMILQSLNNIFVWIGRSSCSTERLNGLNVANRIKNLYGVENVAIVDDGYEQSLNDSLKLDWNLYLNLAQRNVLPMSSAISQLQLPSFKLYKCGFTNSKYRIEEVKSTCLQQSDLSDPNAAFIIDGGIRGVWIWLGRHCFGKDKSEAMRNARGFVKKVKHYLSIFTIFIQYYVSSILLLWLISFSTLSSSSSSSSASKYLSSSSCDCNVKLS